MERKLTTQQKVAKELIRCDLRYLFTILKNRDNICSNYVVSMMPYLSMIIDGAEAWVVALENANPGVIVAPKFTQEEKSFYDVARQSVKLFGMPYEELYALFKKQYEESDRYFASRCNPIAKCLHFYDIFGADLTEDGHFCGNTILDATYLPKFAYGDGIYGANLRDRAVIGGKYISVFNAMDTYEINGDMHFTVENYGGFIKSPVGNEFSFRFVLFSILCQLNFILYAVDRYIVPEIPAKLRFAYILYYYLCDILPQINAVHGTSFVMNRDYYSQEFRNAMAHYKIGVYLKADEIILGDPMFGMTQKAFNCGFSQLKNDITRELEQLSIQLEEFLCLLP